MSKRYREEYQITNPNGDPVGPPQIFEADTKDELIELLKAAHKNAASKFYETKRQVKLGLLMEPDPDRPVQEFVERPLTADERVGLINQLKDPATLDAGMTRFLEAKFGAPISVIRENLQKVEQDKYIEFAREQIELFKLDFPDYVQSESNRQSLMSYLTKKGWPITRKNLGIAYTDLLEEGDILVVRQPVSEKENVVVPAAVATVEEQPAPGKETEITAQPNEETPISESSSVVRPRESSSGLGRNNSSVGVSVTTKVKGITIQEVNAMSSAQYAERLRTDPSFKEQVEALFAPAKK